MLRIKLFGLDWITLLFCLWMACYIAFGWNAVNNPQLHFTAFLSIIALVVLLAWFDAWLQLKPTNHLLLNLIGFIRNYYPVLFYLYFFEVNTAVNKVFFHDWLDPHFYSIDYAIFGYYPSSHWSEMLNGYFWQELFHFAYFCYYPMIVLLPVYFFVRKRKALREMVFCLSFVFYLCYFIFSWLPVIGGRYFEDSMAQTVQFRYGIFTHIMAYIYSHSPHLGGAFPSSHVAIALVLSLMALRHAKPLGIVFLFITFFLTIATVYCHYHWFVDAVAGLVFGFIGFYFALYVYQKLPENKYENIS